MTGSFIDILPPEAQQVLGGISVLVIASGIVVWAAGVKIARFTVAVMLGLGAAALGAWLMPMVAGVTVVTGGLVGFVIGALAGAIGFRLLQGLILATCLGLAIGGIYYRWHIAPEVSGAGGSGASAGDVHVSDLMIPTDRLGGGAQTRPGHESKAGAKSGTSTESWSDIAAKAGQSLVDHWNAIPQVHQRRMLIVSIGAAAVALLIAFGFPRATTWVITAAIGALMIMSGLHALLHVYGPQYEAYLPTTMRARYLTLGILALVGMGVQYRFHLWKGSQKKRVAPPEPQGEVAAAGA
ncbi:MAG TPA: hypothetical protein VM008_21660 [Phycisphaerae bacterium]|nr:hypothetical protein [Phycisphaerae bacterium]